MSYSEADRKRRGKRRKKHYFLNFFILVMALLGAYYICFHSGIFSIKEITATSGAEGIATVSSPYYTPTQIVDLSGVKLGDNIFKTRVSKIEEKLKQDPYIRNAEVNWALPDGLNIVIEERKEKVLVVSGESYAIVDFDGLILRMTEEGLNLPVVAGLTPIAPKPGAPLKAEEAGLLMPILDFFRTVEEHDFYIKKLDVSSVIPKAYVLDRLVIVGELNNINKNIDEVKRVVAFQEAEGVVRGTISVGATSCTFSPEMSV